MQFERTNRNWHKAYELISFPMVRRYINLSDGHSSRGKAGSHGRGRGGRGRGKSGGKGGNQGGQGGKDDNSGDQGRKGGNPGGQGGTGRGRGGRGGRGGGDGRPQSGGKGTDKGGEKGSKKSQDVKSKMSLSQQDLSGMLSTLAVKDDVSFTVVTVHGKGEKASSARKGQGKQKGEVQKKESEVEEDDTYTQREIRGVMTGKVVNLLKDFGFICPDKNLPAPYNKQKNVYFHFTDVKGKPLKMHYRVEFRLNLEKVEKPGVTYVRSIGPKKDKDEAEAVPSLMGNYPGSIQTTRPFSSHEYVPSVGGNQAFCGRSPYTINPCLKILGCGHQCQRLVGQKCARHPGECPLCIKGVQLGSGKKRDMKEQREALIRDTTDELSKIKIGKKNKNSYRSIQVTDGAEVSRFRNLVKQFLGPHTQIDSLCEVSNLFLRQKWLQARLEMNEPLHHHNRFLVVSREIAEKVMKQGFQAMPSFSGERKPSYNHSEEKVLLYCDVLSGRPYTVESDVLSVEELKMRKFDSMYFSKMILPLSDDFFVIARHAVYNPHMILATHIISYSMPPPVEDVDSSLCDSDTESVTSSIDVPIGRDVYSEEELDGILYGTIVNTKRKYGFLRSEKKLPNPYNQKRDIFFVPDEAGLTTSTKGEKVVFLLQKGFHQKPSVQDIDLLPEEQAIVPYIQIDCGHIAFLKAGGRMNSAPCMKKCTNALMCGHRCKLLCSETCPVTCDECSSADITNERGALEEDLICLSGEGAASPVTLNEMGAFQEDLICLSEETVASPVANKEMGAFQEDLVCLSEEPVAPPEASLSLSEDLDRRDIIRYCATRLEELSYVKVNSQDTVKPFDLSEDQRNAAESQICERFGECRLKSVYRVESPAIETRWLKARMAMNNPLGIAEDLIYKTDERKALEIAKYGFGKSHLDTKPDEALQSSPGTVSLLVCDVLTGNEYRFQGGTQQVPDAFTLSSSGYDSLTIPENFDVRMKAIKFGENHILHPDHIFPKFIVNVQIPMEKKISTADMLEMKTVQGPSQEVERHKLTAKRGFDGSDPLDMNYRIVESQFLRFVQKMEGNFEIESVDYYINPDLVRDFYLKKQEFEEKFGDTDLSRHVLAFHGTDPANVDSIIKSNFQVSRSQRGLFGQGIYLSEFPHVSMNFGGSLLLCKVLPGLSYDMNEVRKDAPLQSGYDSHRVKADSNGYSWALVLYDAKQILPCYVINYRKVPSSSQLPDYSGQSGQKLAAISHPLQVEGGAISRPLSGLPGPSSGHSASKLFESPGKKEQVSLPRMV